MTNNYHNLRREYGAVPLDAAMLPDSPMAAFAQWFAQGAATEPLDGNAFVLSTVDPNGAPDARVLLVKEVCDDGFTFFTNYHSAKGQQLLHQALAHATFYWPSLGRQIRMRGICEKLSRDESVAYFHSRPRESQYAAMVSLQSAELASRVQLEQQMQQLIASGTEPSCPESWGGYVLKPNYAEFFQGRDNRLNDRIAYLPINGHNLTSGWRSVRLAP